MPSPSPNRTEVLLHGDDKAIVSSPSPANDGNGNDGVEVQEEVVVVPDCREKPAGQTTAGHGDDDVERGGTLIHDDDDDDDDDGAHQQQQQYGHRRTPIPSKMEHAKILMLRRFRLELLSGKGGELRALIFRTFLGVFMWMLYCVGWMVGPPPSAIAADGRTIVDDQYLVYPRTKWTNTSPDAIYVSGTNDTFVSDIAQYLTGTLRVDTTTIAPAINDSSSSSLCHQALIASNATSTTRACCAFVDSDASYSIYYGNGRGWVAPHGDLVTSCQYAMDRGILAARSLPVLYPATNLQEAPKVLQDALSAIPAPTGTMVSVGALEGIAIAISFMFVVSPLVQEQVQQIVRAFVLVGVHLGTYVWSWIAYLSLWSWFTAGGLTMVAIVWNLYPLSNGFLIFISQYLALVHLNVLSVYVGQVVTSEELAGGIPFLSYLFTTIPAVILVVANFVRYQTLLSVLSALSPFIGIVHFNALFIYHDVWGRGTGIQWDTVRSTGLLGSLLGQLGGILLSSFLVRVHCKNANSSGGNNAAPWPWKKKTKPSSGGSSSRGLGGGEADDDDPVAPAATSDADSSNFESLPANADVLLRINDVRHTFAKRGKDPAKRVLKGLNMEVVRGEVFGFLGHNGAGKTTTIKLVSTELSLQEGGVTYNFKDGTVDLKDDDPSSAYATVRTKIGVCPQHDNLVLGNETCRETLRFFAQLKGNIALRDQHQSVADAIEEEVERRLQQIRLTSPEDADKPVKTFSGGMKRKVSIAIAFLGDPEVVYLDEPTAGMDPYNRRTIWDMILASKEGRSILLTTHFMDEADVLSDRVAIIKNGRLDTCGRGLFLKHTFGTGYKLKFAAPNPIAVSAITDTATQVEPTTMTTPAPAGSDNNINNDRVYYEWNLKHGSEPCFPQVLDLLRQKQASNITLDITTLEQVFLETGQEEYNDDDNDDDDDGADGVVDLDVNLDATHDNKREYLSRIWEQKDPRKPLSYLSKLNIVQRFMMVDALKEPKVMYFLWIQPILYVVIGFVMAYVIGPPEEQSMITPDPIHVAPALGQASESLFYGVPNITANPLAPMIATGTLPSSMQELLSAGLPYTGGYNTSDVTLAFNSTLNPFALQIGVSVLTNYSAILGGAASGISTTIVQLPYLSAPAVNVPLIILPICLAMGFSGVVFAILDVLQLKSANILTLFRVAGINEFFANMGVAVYKVLTTFVPFFFLVIILGLAFSSVVMGNAGRWLATIITMLAYAYSATPMGLLMAQVFRNHDPVKVRQWYPTVYMSTVSIPFIVWVMIMQQVPSAYRAMQILGDVLCIFPSFAFQRALAVIMVISNRSKDPHLPWEAVYSWEARIWYSFTIMFAVGTLEWAGVWYIARQRPPQTKLQPYHPQDVLQPVDTSNDVDIDQERDRAFRAATGIKSREVVKVFSVKPPKKNRSTVGKEVAEELIIKQAVKGMSFGVESNEIYVLLGPNGSGKTTSMAVLTGEQTPEHGTMALDGLVAGGGDKSTDHLFRGCNVSFCPQFDALFLNQTVLEHLKFYAQVRGLDWKRERTQEHVRSIVHPLGLKKYMDTQAGNLSGGYKRRLSLGVAMIGYPKAMLVDECTTGMDPGARHLVWGVLKPDISHDEYDLPAILLSTHYMDEAVQLGSRIGIMMDGKLVATGTLETLRDRYCSSFFVEIAFSVDAPRSMDRETCLLFRDHGMQAEVSESLPQRLKLQVPYTEESVKSKDNVIQLASIFRLLEEYRHKMQIEFYSVAQMSLEQIFIKLSREQFDANESFRVRSGRELGVQ